MTDYAIACGCGRAMTPDGRAGRGAYRCGCGARVRIQEARSAAKRCSYESCRNSAVTQPPLLLCEEHQQDAVLQLAHLVTRHQWDVMAQASTAPNSCPRSADSYRQPAAPSQEGWVYFMRRERLIKIGTTGNLKQRAQQVNAVILARIPGSYTEEAQLHARFAALRRHGEWFEPGPELLELINRIRADDGRPPISAE